jgi:hypothetical protein
MALFWVAVVGLARDLHGALVGSSRALGHLSMGVSSH